MAIAFAAPAQALEWRFEPTLDASAIYTDNVNQSDSNPEDALILSVMPGFSLHTEGSHRVKAMLQYGMRGVARFSDAQNTDKVFHHLNAAGSAELVEDFLYIDGSARISQQLISLLGSSAEAEVNDSNRATTGTYMISPYIQKRLGTFANVQARYTASGMLVDSNAAADSSVNAFSAGLSSGTRFNDLSWALNYSIRKANNRNAATAAANSDTTLERASATAGYALTRKFRVFGTVGQDWNDYLSASATDGSFYSAGFGWSPSRRTSFEVSAGEHYFGRTFGLSAMHRARTSNWTARYSEGVSDVTQRLLEASSELFFVCTADPWIIKADELLQAPPTGCAGPYPAAYIIENTNLPDSVYEYFGLKDSSLARGIYVFKTFHSGVTWNLGRLGLGVSVHDSKRIYQELNEGEDRVQGVSGTASYTLSPRTTANGNLSFTRTSIDNVATAREYDTLGLSLGLNHAFAEKLSGTLTFRHIQRDSNEANSSYDENRLTATVSMGF